MDVLLLQAEAEAEVQVAASGWCALVLLAVSEATDRFMPTVAVAVETRRHQVEVEAAAAYPYHFQRTHSMELCEPWVDGFKQVVPHQFFT
jgi:hypothetical protein